MSNNVVVDTSIVIKWVIDEADSSIAVALLASGNLDFYSEISKMLMRSIAGATTCKQKLSRRSISPIAPNARRGSALAFHNRYREMLPVAAFAKANTPTMKTKFRTIFPRSWKPTTGPETWRNAG